MSGHDETGHPEPHTPALPADDAADRTLPGADPEVLLAGSPDVAASDLLALAAEPALTHRRGRGRPPGAANRKNNDMIQYLAALGHRDPWVTLSLIQTADFRDLCKMVGATSAKMKLAILNVQRAAAEALMPYHHAKRPTQVELPLGDTRPFMVIGEMNVSVTSPDGFMSAGEPAAKIIENQEVSESPPVRTPKPESHE